MEPYERLYIATILERRDFTDSPTSTYKRPRPPPPKLVPDDVLDLSDSDYWADSPYVRPPTRDLTKSPYFTESFSSFCSQYHIFVDQGTCRPLDGAKKPEASRRLEVVIVDTSVGQFNIKNLKKANDLKIFKEENFADIIIQPDNAFRRNKRLVVFDMDSTLIEQEVIDEIAAFVGVKDKVSEITASAMRGELDFTKSLRARAALLNGVPATVFETLKTNGAITFTPGVRNLCTALKRLGYKLAVVSGGFTPLANWVKDELNLDYAYANNLAVSEDGQTLTGEVVGDIVNAERKKELLIEISKKENIDLRQVVAVGDGANDLPMMGVAGLGIAFNAKHTVVIDAPSSIQTPNIQDILFVLGFSEAEQKELISEEYQVSLSS